MKQSKPRPERVGLRGTDLVVEAAVGVTVKPLRSVLTVAGIAVGVAALVATVGLAATTTRAVSERFDDLRAQEVTLVAESTADVPADVDERLAQVPGVRTGGLLSPVTGNAAQMMANRVGPSIDVSVVGATNGGLSAIRPEISGRSLDPVFRHRRVALIGRDLADSLGVRHRAVQTTIFIDDVPFTVLGFIDGTERESSLRSQVVVPYSTATAMWPNLEPVVLIDVEPGAAIPIAAVAPLVLRPEEPEAFEVRLMPEARGLRGDIAAELDQLGLAVAVTVLVVAGIAVAATMSLSVLERRSEIGLHRALGARPLHIGVRFLAEASMIGMIGGVIGTSAGVAVVGLAGSIREAVPTIPAWTLPSSVALGLAVSLVAGAYPAVRAARLDPVVALRD